MGFSGGPGVENSSANAGNVHSIPYLGKATCCGGTKPVCHNYWACGLEPTCHINWNPCA